MRPRRTAARLVIVALATATGLGSFQAAQARPGDPGDDRFTKGKIRLDLHAGYAIPFKFSSSNVSESEFVAIFPRASIGLSRVLGPESWYRGAFEFGVEGEFIVQTRPHSGRGLGASALFRYNFLSFDRFVPWYELGAGVLDLDFDLDKRADGFNFSLHNGVGIHWLAWDRAALSAQFRWHHISNAGISGPNHAVDSALMMVGMTYFLD